MGGKGLFPTERGPPGTRLSISPTVHKDRVPQVFQDGARPLDVTQAAVLLGLRKDAVRSACASGELEHQRYLPNHGRPTRASGSPGHDATSWRRRPSSPT